MKFNIKVDQNRNKFYALIEGKECVINFRTVKDHILEYYSTFVPKDLRRRGIAGELVEYALKYAQEHNKKVVPSCSYVRSYIEKNPQWSVIVER
jgi:uncharacterized protein